MKVVRVLAPVLWLVVVAIVASIYPWATRGSAWLNADWQLPHALWLLALLPPAWVWIAWGHPARRPRLQIGTTAPLTAGPVGFRPRLVHLPPAIRIVALAFLVLALARPVSTLRADTGNDKGIDIVLAIDLSGSMRAILDGNPSGLPGSVDLQPGQRLTRLDTAKLVLNDFISRRTSDRIGVVVFGKAAYVLAPPTLDYPLLSQMVSKMTLDVIDGSGTAIGDGLATAVARLRKSDALSKVIVLITDGDNNSGSVSPDYASRLAATQGAKVYTIQIGTDDEVEVQDGVDLFGRPHFVKTRFPVNPELLKKIASETGGEAFIATDGQALAKSMHTVLNQLEKTRFESLRASYEELFPLLLIPGAVLLAIEALLVALVLRRFP